MKSLKTPLRNPGGKSRACTKMAAYFPDLKKHKMNWNNDDGSYYNDFSIIQIKEKFNEIGLKDSEFSIRSLKVDDQNDALDYQTIIEIHKTQ